MLELVSLMGREESRSSVDMVSSSSASQSDITDEGRGEVSGEGVDRYNDGGLGFRRIMARFQDLILEPFQSLLPALLTSGIVRTDLRRMVGPERSTLTDTSGIRGRAYVLIAAT